MAAIELETAGTIRKGRKYEQVLEGARTVFLADGFEGASVDDIARVAGVSKATLYSYFPDKRLLFREVYSTECNRMSEEVHREVDLGSTAQEGLRKVAERLLRILLSDFAMDMFRICLSERIRFPELGPAYYAAGPELARRRLTDYISFLAGRGELNVEDAQFAADQFYELCRAGLWPRAIIGVQSDFSDEEIDRVCDGAVAVFMKFYGREAV